jgi:hypothetical protein
MISGRWYVFCTDNLNGYNSSMQDISGNRSEGASRSALGPIGLSVGLYALLCLVIFVAIRKVNQGHFLFSLDDPYIHLALANQIAHGHYGINPGEAASPSSSLIWPLLLALFSHTNWQPYAALGLNFLAGLGGAVLVGWNVANWPKRDRTVEEHADRIISVVLLIVIGNLVGLTFVGMEHTLQVMLAGCCATGMIFCLQGRRIPTWCIVATALGPMVRYENLGLSVALAIALAGQKEWKRAASLMVASTGPLVAFSICLRKIGLPMLPNSVLVKGGVTDTGQSTLGHLVHSYGARPPQQFGRRPTDPIDHVPYPGRIGMEPARQGASFRPRRRCLRSRFAPVDRTFRLVPSL